jgi:hypothetical protein
MVLAVAPLAEVLPTVALEGDRGGVEEDQLEIGEERRLSRRLKLPI